MEAWETGFDADLIGLALKLWRDECDKAQVLVEEEARLPQSTVSAMEGGRSLTPRNLALLLAYYGKTMTDLHAKVREIRAWPLAARQTVRKSRTLPDSPRPRTRGKAARNSSGKKDRQPHGSKA